MLCILKSGTQRILTDSNVEQLFLQPNLTLGDSATVCAGVPGDARATRPHSVHWTLARPAGSELRIFELLGGGPPLAQGYLPTPWAVHFGRPRGTYLPPPPS